MDQIIITLEKNMCYVKIISINKNIFSSEQLKKLNIIL